MRKLLIYVLVLFFSPACLFAQEKNANEKIREGNQLYATRDFEKAAAMYREALALDPGNSTARFNLASAIARQGKQDDAVNEFSRLAKDVKEAGLRSKSYYNQGAVLTKQKKLAASIEAYKQALRVDPNDRQARENLQKALLEQRRNNPPPKKDDKKKKQEQQKKDRQQQPKMKEKEAEQRLDLLEQKEKEIQQRMQKAKSNQGGGTGKDW